MKNPKLKPYEIMDRKDIFWAAGENPEQAAEAVRSVTDMEEEANLEIEELTVNEAKDITFIVDENGDEELSLWDIIQTLESADIIGGTPWF